MTPNPACLVELIVERMLAIGILSHPMVNMPVEMRDLSRPIANDWIPWKLIQSTATDSEIQVIEQRIGYSYPPLYKSLIKSYHYFGLQAASIRLAENPIHIWQARLLRLHSDSKFLEMDPGLLPFGDEGFLDAGPVCFDFRHSRLDSDPPVVFWSLENSRTSEAVQPLFSTTSAMFSCLEFCARYGSPDMFYRDPDDDSETIRLKQDSLAKFLAIDPKGAGGPARDYWNSAGLLSRD